MAKRSLNKVEEQIETNVRKAWYDNGLLLREIRDDKLYKKKYGTFEEYADQRWGWQRRHVYRMIEAAERFQAIENVSQNGSLGHKILPSNESQVRPLTELSDAAAVVRMLASGVVLPSVTGCYFCSGNTQHFDI